MSGQLRQVFWATRSVLYCHELPCEICEGKTVSLVALMPGVQGGIPLILRIRMYPCWPKNSGREKGLSKEESELLRLWSVSLLFLSSLTAKKTHWYWPDPLTACFYSSWPPYSALPVSVTSDFAHHYPLVITHSASFSHYIWEALAVRGVPFPAAAPGLAVRCSQSSQSQHCSARVQQQGTGLDGGGRQPEVPLQYGLVA